MQSVPADGEWVKWLAGLLWPSANVWSGPQRALPNGYDRVDGFAVLPNLRAPRLLVPLSSARGRAAPFLQFNDSMGWGARLRNAALAAGFGSGAARSAVRGRLVVLPTPSLDGSDSIEARLRETLGRAEVRVAVSLGSRDRLNVKPVLRVMTGRGRTLGFLKVPGNELTTRLAANELTALRAWEARPPTSFSVARVIASFRWRETGLGLMSPLPVWGIPTEGQRQPPPVEVLSEIAERSSLTREKLSESRWWSSLRARATALTAGAREADDILDVLDQAERAHGSAVLSFGAWHGDLAPWNVARGPEGISIWDWERSGGPVPLGFDALHYAFRPRLSNVPDAARRALVEAEPALRALGCDPARGEALVRLYLLERLARVAEAERLGTTGPGSAERFLRTFR